MRRCYIYNSNFGKLKWGSIGIRSGITYVNHLYFQYSPDKIFMDADDINLISKNENFHTLENNVNEIKNQG